MYLLLSSRFNATFLAATTIISFLSSCSNGCEDAFFKENLVAIEMNTLQDKNLSISEIGYDINIIPLETTDSCLLKGNAHIIYVSQQDVFISDGKIIFRFGNDGKFKNTIGIVGNGPMEHNAIFSASVDSKQNLVHIYNGYKKIITWDFSGKPVSETSIQTQDYIPSIFQLGDEFYAEERAYSKDENMQILLTRFDMKGKKKESKKILELNGVTETNYYPASIISQKTDSYNYFNPYSSSLYRITNDTIQVEYKFDFGNMNIDKRQLGNMDYRKQHSGEYIEILDIIISSDSIFLLYHNGNNICSYVRNRVTGDVLLHSVIINPRKGGGLKLCAESELCVWPHFSKNNTLYSLCNLSDYESLPDIINISESPYKIDDNSNPCVLIMTRKY